jgi:hypothetical protein
MTTRTTAADVVIARREHVEARTALCAACRAYAKQATGWSCGDRLRRRTGEVVEVVRFTDTHPRTWQIDPVVICRVVRRDGSIGVRERYLTIDIDGRWSKRWSRVSP